MSDVTDVLKAWAFYLSTGLSPNVDPATVDPTDIDLNDIEPRYDHLAAKVGSVTIRAILPDEVGRAQLIGVMAAALCGVHGPGVQPFTEAWGMWPPKWRAAYVYWRTIESWCMSTDPPETWRLPFSITYEDADGERVVGMLELYGKPKYDLLLHIEILLLWVTPAYQRKQVAYEALRAAFVVLNLFACDKVEAAVYFDDYQYLREQYLSHPMGRLLRRLRFAGPGMNTELSRPAPGKRMQRRHIGWYWLRRTILDVYGDPKVYRRCMR